MDFFNDNLNATDALPVCFSNLLNAKQAAQTLPNSKSENTLIRWMRRGLVSRSSQRIRLRHVRVGDELYTSEKWLMEFFTKLAKSDCAYFDDAADQPSLKNNTPTKRPKTRRQKDIARAESYLDSRGI